MLQDIYSSEKKFYSTNATDESSSQSSTSLFTIEQPSTSTNSSIVDDTILSDSLVENIHVPETVDVGDKDIKAEVDQSLEEGRCEDSAATSSTVQPSDTGDVAIQNLCFFCNKKGSKISLRLSRCALQKKINLEKLFYQILIQIVIFTTKP